LSSILYQIVLAIFKGEYKNVKRKFLLSLLVLALILGLFTGCEQEPSLPRIAATLKGYNDEITALIVSHVSGNAPETFTEGTMDTVDVGFTCRVDYSDTDTLDLEVFLDIIGEQLTGLKSVGISKWESSIMQPRSLYPAYIPIVQQYISTAHRQAMMQTYSTGMHLQKHLSLN